MAVVTECYNIDIAGVFFTRDERTINPLRADNTQFLAIRAEGVEGFINRRAGLRIRKFRDKANLHGGNVGMVNTFGEAAINIKCGDIFELSHYTFTSTTLVVSLPKMSITLTAILYRPGCEYECFPLTSSNLRSLRVR